MVMFQERNMLLSVNRNTFSVSDQKSALASEQHSRGAGFSGYGPTEPHIKENMAQLLRRINQTVIGMHWQ